MRKLTTILLALILCAALFVSCDANVIEETVSINFDGNARSLTASLENFDKNEFYWKYTATKSTDDNSGLTSGATTGETWLKTNGTDKLKGLGSVSGFSQGKWDFVLYAYKDTNAGSKPAYKGEVKGFSLKKGNDNTVTVTVSPVSDENANGTLVLNRSSITFKPKDEVNNSNNALIATTQVYHVTKLNDLNEISPIDGTDTWSLKPGPYTVTVEFVKDGFIYATGSVVATIYSNLTTTVSGELTEQLTKASFDAEKNPDIINIVVGKETNYKDIDDATPITLTRESNNKVSAAVPASAAKSIVKEVLQISDGEQVPSDAKIELNLSVDTTAATSTSLSLEIGMSAIVTHTDENNGIQQTSKVIESLTSRVTVTAQLQTGLKDVKVTHKGELMTALTDLSADVDGFNYNAETGVLTIKTKSFSPFEVEYKAPIYEAKINELKYESLEKAIKAAQSGDEIILLKDVHVEAQINLPEGVTLNGMGHTIKANNASWSGTNGYKNLLKLDTNTTVKNITLDSNSQARGVQAYVATNVTFENINAINAFKGHGIIINASQATFKGLIHMENNEWGNDINLGWGSNINVADDFKCSIDVSEATIECTEVGAEKVKMAVWTDPSDLQHARLFAGEIPDGFDFAKYNEKFVVTTKEGQMEFMKTTVKPDGKNGEGYIWVLK